MRCTDASEMEEWVEPESISAIMTAPPIVARSWRVEDVRMPVTAFTETMMSLSAVLSSDASSSPSSR